MPLAPTLVNRPYVIGNACDHCRAGLDLVVRLYSDVRAKREESSILVTFIENNEALRAIMHCKAVGRYQTRTGGSWLTGPFDIKVGSGNLSLPWKFGPDLF